MKLSKLMFLAIGAAIIFSGCSKDEFLAPELDQIDQAESTLKSATKPAAHLTGIMALDFNLFFLGNPALPVWEGTIDLEGYGLYGMRFFSLSAPRDYSQASPFEEDFIIYELGNPTNVYAEGWEAGVASHANRAPDPMKFVTNGKIEKAYGPLEMWEGRNVHISGIVENWVDHPIYGLIPEYATSTMRIN